MLFSSVEKAFLTEDCRAVRGDQHPPGYGNSLPTDDSGTPEGFDQTIQRPARRARETECPFSYQRPPEVKSDHRADPGGKAVAL